MGWTVLGTVLGALIGALASLSGQQISARAADRRDRLQRQENLERERREAVNAFWAAEQEAERIAEDRGKYDHDTLTKVHSTLWLQYKCLALICSPELDKPLEDLTLRLSTLMWQGPSEGVTVSQDLDKQYRLFMALARNKAESKEPG